MTVYQGAMRNLLETLLDLKVLISAQTQYFRPWNLLGRKERRMKKL